MINSILLNFLSAYFAISGLLKLINLKYFIGLVKEFKIFKYNLSILLAIIVPIMETISALLIHSNIYRIYALCAIVLLLSSFGVVIFSAINKKLIISCGCYGKLLDSKVDYFTLYKICFFEVITLYLIFNYSDLYQHFSTGLLLVGLICTLLVLAFQKLLDIYKDNIKLLRQ